MPAAATGLEALLLRMENRRVQFETGVDDVVDATVRYWRRSPAGQSQRRRAILNTTVAFTVCLFVVAWLQVGLHARLSGPLALVALVLGGVVWLLYGRYYDYAFRRNVFRTATEQSGDDTSWLCEIELRDDGVWSRSRGVEYLFHWSALTRIEPSGDGVEFHFRDGFVMARDRAFSLPAERAAFLDSAARLAAR